MNDNSHEPILPIQSECSVTNPLFGNLNGGNAMPDQSNQRPPPTLIVLEILGTVLLFLGLLEIYGKIDIVPSTWQFQDYGWYMVVAGFLLGIPHLLATIRNSKNKPNSLPS
jgi:hypothetical protein